MTFFRFHSSPAITSHESFPPRNAEHAASNSGMLRPRRTSFRYSSPFPY